MRRRLALFLLAVTASRLAAAPPVVDLADEEHRQFVVRQGAQAPASALLADGRTLLAAFPSGDGTIEMRRGLDGGRAWVEAAPVTVGPGFGESALLHRAGPLLLFAGGGAGVRALVSADSGASWTPAAAEPAVAGAIELASVAERGGATALTYIEPGSPARVVERLTRDGARSWERPRPLLLRHGDLGSAVTIPSPDGKRLALIAGIGQAGGGVFILNSKDNGATWTGAKAAPAALVGRGHVARYAPDGRLFVAFQHLSPGLTRGDIVGWTGSWDDLVAGGEGQYLVRLLKNADAPAVLAPALEVLDDGAFVALAAGRWQSGAQPAAVAVRFKMAELDDRAAFASPGEVANLVVGTGEEFPPPSRERPNVLFVAFDDLNDWWLEPDSPVRLPNLERLARRGVLFERAYTASPACNPSRAALLTGLATARTGVYGNRSDWRAAVPEAATLPRYFLEQGYRVEGAGKVFHHHDNSAFHDARSFHRFERMQLDPMPARKLNDVYEVGSRNYDWGPWPFDEDETPDARAASYAERFLAAPRDRPFFLAIGLFRPHMPFHAPPRHFARFPLAGLPMPAIRANDLADIAPGGRALWEANRHFWDAMQAGEARRPGTWRDSVRSYLASCAFADEQLGRVLDALEASPHAANTVVVVWSDHGYHLGEKDHWEKFALWEKTTRVPLVVAAPGVAGGGRVRKPVSLLDLYPTLVELAGLPQREGLDGRSLAPLLHDPGAAWDRPAVMTYLEGNHAVRDERWRYIRYADGSEELYDHLRDPREWTNVADRHPEVTAALSRWLPTENAPPAANLPRR